MADPNEQPIAISLGDSSQVRRFRSWNSLLRFFESERAKWEWLAATNNPGNIMNTVTDRFQRVVDGIKATRDSGTAMESVVGLVEEAYQRPSGPLRDSDGEIGTAILDIRGIAGDNAAAFAYAFEQRLVNINQGTLDDLRGALLIAFPQVIQAAEIAKRLSTERANNKAAQLSAIDRLDAAHAAQHAHFADLLNRGVKIAVSTLRRRRDAWNMAQSKWASGAEETQSHWANTAASTLAEITTVKAAFEEHMKLQAPVQYWTAKAKGHGDRERRYLAFVASFFAVGGILLGGAFYEVATRVLGASSRVPGGPEPTALYVVSAAGLTALTTLVFWVGRLLTKLYLSEHHLRNDADERAVMTTTYLALTREGQASDADRQIILTALFRSSPDGIVKDEGAGDVSIQGLLARLLTR